MFFFDNYEEAEPEINSNIATINFNDDVYAESMDSLYNQIVELTNNDKIDTICLKINSFGGDAIAIQKFNTDVKQIKNKKIISYVSNTAYSAGVLLYSIADEVIMHPDAKTGSIGAITGFIVETESAPYKRKIYKSGKFKTGEDTSEHDEYYENSIKECANIFVYSIVENRKGKTTSDAIFAQEAKTFYAKTALELGLVDKILTTSEFNAYMLTMTINDTQKGENMSINPTGDVVANTVPQAQHTANNSHDISQILAQQEQIKQQFAALEAAQRAERVESLAAMIESTKTVGNAKALAESLVASNPKPTAQEIFTTMGFSKPVSVEQATANVTPVTEPTIEDVAVKAQQEKLVESLTQPVAGSNSDSKKLSAYDYSFIAGKCLHIDGVI